MLKTKHINQLCIYCPPQYASMTLNLK